jgi:threonine dehydrogenase-like Zn-dependent dehydrogenase
VVFGAGPIGLATLVAATHAGARVLSVDPVPGRRDLAKRLGAEVVAWGSQAEITELTWEWTSGVGPPLIVETSGEPGVLAEAVELTPSAGRIVVIGMSSGTAPVRPGAFPEKEIDVIGSSCATAADFGAAISLVAANRSAVAHVFSHHFPLVRAAEAFEFAMSRPPDAIKIVVTVN